jgi:hypothetical protein
VADKQAALVAPAFGTDAPLSVGTRALGSMAGTTPQHSKIALPSHAGNNSLK